MAYTSKSVFAALPRTQRGAPLVLGGDPKGKNFLYAVGNSVVIRNIDEPALSDVYTEHSCAVNVAKYSPSGFYIASGDVSGKVRIWDTVNKEHILKNEFQPLGGTVKDIAWSADSQRMCAVGDGRERFGHVFMADTGTSVGEISGQAKTINSVDFRPARPFRIVTASEDNTVAVFEGPPFKFKCTKQDHSRYVQAVRYSPDGSVFASAGFDGKIFLYEGASSELKCEIGSPAHKGGVYGLAWAPDGRRLLSCSGDKTCRLWDVETARVVSEFVMGTTVDDQQVSCLWQGRHLLSVSLSGFVNYLNVDDPSKPIRIVKGHNKPITALTLDDDKKQIYTASHDGFVTEWNALTGENDRIGGAGHGNQINGLRCFGEHVYSCGIDDSLRKATRGSASEPGSYCGEAVALGSQPRAMDVYEQKSLVVIGTVKEVLVLSGDRKVSSLTAFYEPSAVSVNQTNGDVAVGGAADNKVHIYTLHDDFLTPGPELKHLGPITDCKYSPDGKYLVACDTNRKVIVYSVEDYKLAHNKEWGFHTARVNCVAWSDDSSRVASGSLDTCIIVWTLSQPNKHLIIKNAHPQSQITSLAWLDNETIVSVGQDCNTKLWTVPVA